MSIYKRHLDHTIKIINDAFRVGPFAINWSTGKDSTAMCHLIKSMFPKAHVIIQFDDCDWPEKKEYAYRIADKYGWEINEVIPNFSVWALASKYKIGFDDICSQSHEVTAKSFIAPLENKRQELSCIGSFIGLRAEESKARKINAAVKGELYQLKSGIWHCCPLAWWEVLDVFAYLVTNNIEINPCYFHNLLRQPEDIRLSWALPTPIGACQGDIEHIRRYYPRQFAKLRNAGVHE